MLSLMKEVSVNNKTMHVNYEIRGTHSDLVLETFKNK